jgi:hypothetical protein
MEPDGDGRLSQGIDRLQVWAAVRTAFESIWLHRRQLAGWSVLPLVLVVVIELLSQPFIGGLDRIVSAVPDAEWLPGAVAAGQLRNALQIAVWTGLELSCYRLFLLGAGAGLSAPHRRAIFASLLVFNLALLALSSGPTVAFDYARIVGGMAEAEFFSLLFFPIYYFVAVRLAFVFPAISLGWPWDLRQRWSETKGNFLRLFGAYMLGYIPMMVLISLFSALGFDVSTYELSDAVSPILEAAARSVISLVALLTATAITAAAVAQLTGFRAAGMTGQGPGPTEIAKRFD